MEKQSFVILEVYISLTFPSTSVEGHLCDVEISYIKTVKHRKDLDALVIILLEKLQSLSNSKCRLDYEGWRNTMKEKVQKRKAKSQKTLGSLQKTFYSLTTQPTNALEQFHAVAGSLTIWVVESIYKHQNKRCGLHHIRAEGCSKNKEEKFHLLQNLPHTELVLYEYNLSALVNLIINLF